MIYFSNFKDELLIYSVDMIRLTAYTTFNIIDDLRSLLCVFNDLYYEVLNNKIGTYKYNYTYGGVYYGFFANSPKGEGSSNITIEFNPNKVDFTSNYGHILLHFLSVLRDSLYVKRFDLAVDIPKKIVDLSFENLNKRDYLNFYKYHENYTIYFGKKDGHTKIYNKTIESNLSYDLTRYEVTKYVDFAFSECPPDINFHFLNVQLLPYTCLNSENDTMKAVVYALNNGYHLKDLSYYIRREIQSQQPVVFNLKNDCGVKALIECLNSLRNLVKNENGAYI